MKTFILQKELALAKRIINRIHAFSFNFNVCVSMYAMLLKHSSTRIQVSDSALLYKKWSF